MIVRKIPTKANKTLCSIDLSCLYSDDSKEVIETLNRLHTASHELLSEVDNFDYDTHCVEIRQNSAQSLLIGMLIKSAKEFHGCPFNLDLETYLTEDQF